MAKRRQKKAAPKPKARRQAAPKQRRKVAESILRKGPIRKRQPTDQILAGMEDVVDTVLDRVHRDYREQDDIISAAAAEKASLEADAKRRMRQIAKESGKHSMVSRRHGIQFTWSVAEEEVFKAKRYKTQATPSAEPDAADVEAMDAVDATADAAEA